MAHQAHNIPWGVFASNLQYVHANSALGGVTNLFFRFRETQGKELNYFVEAFARTIREHSECEWRKYPEKPSAPDDDELVISAAAAKKIAPTMHHLFRGWDWRRAAAIADEFTSAPCTHTDEDERCACPVPYPERKMAAFLYLHHTGECYEFESTNGRVFFCVEMAKALVMHGEMESMLRLCAHPGFKFMDWWSVGQCQCAASDAGWEFVCKNALDAYLCLNTLYCFPEIWDPASGATAEKDYRLTKCYRRMLRRCTLSGTTSQIAALPHRQFFGIADGQFKFKYHPMDWDLARWGHGGSEGSEDTSRLFLDRPFERFLECDDAHPPYLPHADDLGHVRRILCAKGLPMELVLDIMELADYTAKRRLKVPHDPFHLTNREELVPYLTYCWKILVHCDMVFKALGQREIPWENFITCAMMDFWGLHYKRHKQSAHNKRKMFDMVGLDDDDNQNIVQYHEQYGFKFI
ncbi:hypothetical protein F5Y14DRAFT_266862 [Nemania sp. NC0429]|nr:hypothetical protein F5Y14DRAFT_266862 [Nemania sp. NC0429]